MPTSIALNHNSLLCAALLLSILAPPALSQYANRYSNSEGGTSSQMTSTEAPSKRSGYKHSAVEIGELSSVGYDDLTAYRPKLTPGGSFRKPKSIELLSSTSAIIATQATGELYRLDFASQAITPVFRSESSSLTKTLVLSDRLLAVLDVAKHQTLIIDYQITPWQVVTRLSTPGFPHSLAWDSDSRSLFVTGQWSQRVYRFRAAPNLSDWQTLPSTDVQLHGGEALWLPNHQSLVVTDAFSGSFVVLRPQSDDQPLTATNTSTLYAHNITGLESLENGQWTLAAFQLLNPDIHSVQGNITWGGVLSNNLRWIKTDRLLSEKSDDIVRESRFVPLGEVGNGAGDPTAIALGPQEQIAIPLGGIDHVAVGELGSSQFRKYAVGLHPIDAVFDPSGRHLFVLNELCDSVSHIDLNSQQIEHIELGPLREPTLAERGERLFFHSVLAHDNWMSCHSCHSRGHANGQLNDNTSDGSLGSPKRVLSLLGQADTAPYSWVGEINELELQVLHSIQSTMATDHKISRDTIDAIAAYIRTLPAPPSLLAARNELPSNDRLIAGRNLFDQLSCSNCHAGSSFTSIDRFDVGLQDENGTHEFNPPSLLGVSQRSRSLLHDARAHSLAEVLTVFKHQLPRDLNAAEQSLLIEYLQSL